jgi:hypothetical protein
LRCDCVNHAADSASSITARALLSSLSAPDDSGNGCGRFAGGDASAPGRAAVNHGGGQVEQVGTCSTPLYLLITILIPFLLAR